MRTLQYCYFALKSTTVSAEDITNRLLMQPDEVMVMGSRHHEHRLPRCHAWKIVRRSTESVDDQLRHLVDRLGPVHPRLVTLVTDAEVSPVMQVVRYFHHENGVQAGPLGWSLPPQILQFLNSTRTMLDGWLALAINGHVQANAASAPSTLALTERCPVDVKVGDVSGAAFEVGASAGQWPQADDHYSQEGGIGGAVAASVRTVAVAAGVDGSDARAVELVERGGAGLDRTVEHGSQDGDGRGRPVPALGVGSARPDSTA